MARYTIEDTTITNIANAIREQNGSTNKYNPSQMPDAIRAIETGGGSSDEWQPQPDWWDIDKILAEDTEDYPAKMIVLFTDENESTVFNHITGAVKLKLSDGTSYDFTQAINHTWDTSKDKECSFGYKTRYYIVYFSSTEITLTYTSFLTYRSDVTNSLLYVILKNLDAKLIHASGNTYFNYNNLLEKVKCINSIITTNGQSLNTCPSLVEIDNVNVSNGFYNFFGDGSLKKINSLSFETTNKSMGYMFGSTLFTEINLDDTSNVVDFANAFQGCSKLKRINKLDFNSATNINNMFQSCSNLLSIDEIANIKITGLNFTQSTLLRKDTLIRILNALYNYASEGSTATYTLTLGTTNLAKLTDEEKTIATNKGWTLA